MLRFIAGFFVCLAVVPAVGVAEEMLPLEDEYLASDIPIVLTASRLAQQRALTAGSITIIDREMIQAAGAKDVRRVLRLVPGLLVGHSPTNTPVTYHGISSGYAQRMQVLVDGRSIYSPTLSVVDWNMIPVAVDDIERIEVFRGPNGVTYGANSFLAVINIMTRHPGTESSWASTVMSGQHGQNDLFFRQAWRSDSGNSRLSLRHAMVDDLKAIRDSITQDSLIFRHEYQLSPQDSLSVNMVLLTESQLRGNGTGINPDRERLGRVNQEQVKWRRAFGPEDEMQVNIYQHFYRVDDRYLAQFPIPDRGVFPQVLSQTLRSQRYNLEFFQTKRLSTAFRMVWGAETRQDRVSGVFERGMFDTPKTFKVVNNRIFVDSQWQATGHLTVSTGVMYERSSETREEASPRLGINYTLDENNAFRLVYSTAARLPSVGEQRIAGTLVIPELGIDDNTFLGNPDLEQEDSRAWELGYHGDWKQQRWMLDIRAFQESLKNLIIFYTDKTYNDSDGTVATYANDGRSLIHGVEMEISWRPGKKNIVYLSSALMSNRGHIRLTTESDGTKTYLDAKDLVPSSTFSLLFQRQLPHRWYFSTSYQHVGEFAWIDGKEMKAYETLDLRISKVFQEKPYKTTIEFVAQDALGDYVDFNDSRFPFNFLNTDYRVQPSYFIVARVAM